ncbi:hypothetical protein LOTGIDRAFT_174988 [Lottia gigantea]|uniref:Integrase catalytic domain-containing protein n=1 Tax=Lottia gigantea TaxID=225164 RepID=V4AGG3_LOTGI|nr:hypothetical protein LOTGIDRAFT_174988 [Lottia gigantea]ESO95967.1 hypothetical protein LOTGIDRAFT_174988 [Lottia gigantea]
MCDCLYCFIDDEKAETLRDALLWMCIELRPVDGPYAVVRTDPVPGFKALVNDQLLRQQRVSIEVGRVKNQNKNPVAEKAVQELINEILRQEPMGGRITPLILSLATARLNTRIRSSGLSAREMWTQRDQFQAHPIPLNDLDLIQGKTNLRLKNHQFSEKSKAPYSKVLQKIDVCVGDLVYLISDGGKSNGRNRYLVTSVKGQWCYVRKFIGNQLRKTSYRVKMSDCFRVGSCDKPDDSIVSESDNDLSDDELDSPPLSQCVSPPIPPDIPSVLSTPADIVDPLAVTLPEQNMSLEEPRRFNRVKRLPQKFNDFVMN